LPFRDWNLVAHKQIVVDMIGYVEYIKRARTESPADEKEIRIEDSVLLMQGPGELPLLPVAVKGV